MTNPQAESIALFFKNDSSDKEYHVHLKEKNAQWIVEIQYGKRGSALRSSLKTKEPLDFALAKKAYDKIVAEQIRDGYSPSGAGAAYQDTPLEKRFTGNVPQLSNPIDEEGFEAYLDDEIHMIQEKFDGERMMIARKSDAVVANNRNALEIAAPKIFADTLMSLPCASCLIDGEWLGDRFAPFDLLELDGVDLKPLGAKERKAKLDELLKSAYGETFLYVETAFTPDEKRKLHDFVKAANGEGVVGKRSDSPYEPGRPNSGGNHVKRKFVESATLFVTAIHKTKSSVSVGCLTRTGEILDCGNLTIHENKPVPEVGSIVEVMYLYAHAGGKLAQAVYKGPRTDQGREACLESQLKYKAEGPATAPKKSRPRA